MDSNDYEKKEGKVRDREPENEIVVVIMVLIWVMGQGISVFTLLVEPLVA